MKGCFGFPDHGRERPVQTFAAVGYGFVISPSTVVSVGATYGLGSSKASEASTPGFKTATKANNQLSVYVEPGFLTSVNTLVYAKLSYEKAEMEISGDLINSSKSINGTSFGFGVRTMIHKTTYLQVEVKQIEYGSERFAGDNADFKTKATVGTVGIGMRF